MYSTNASVLNDITTGSNPVCETKGFPASVGWDPVESVVDHALTFMTTGDWFGHTDLGESAGRCRFVKFGPAEMSSGRICDRFHILGDKITTESDRMYTAPIFSVRIQISPLLSCSLSRRLALQRIICCALHCLHSHSESLFGANPTSSRRSARNFRHLIYIVHKSNYGHSRVPT